MNLTYILILLIVKFKKNMNVSKPSYLTSLRRPYKTILLLLLTVVRNSQTDKNDCGFGVPAYGDYNNNASVQYNGGLLPDIILLTRCGYIGEPV